MNKKLFKIFGAFTLAEVLITLTIIGVIAVLTIPNLIKSWDERHTVSAVKEAYSIFNNAFKMIIREEGYLNEWNWPTGGDGANSYIYPEFLAEKLKPYIKTTGIYSTSSFKTLTGKDLYNCYQYQFKNLNGNNGDVWKCNYQKAVLLLANGMTAILDVHRWMPKASSNFSGQTDSCIDCSYGVITVDTNGYKRGPNRWGYDIFAFTFYFDGLQLKRDTSWSSTSSYQVCTKSGTQKTYSLNGISCSYWIMMHGNTDYQKREVGGDTKWAKN